MMVIGSYMTKRIEQSEAYLFPDVHHCKKDNDKSNPYTLPPLKPDSFGGKVSKPERLEFSKDEIKNMLINQKHNHTSLPTLEDYASNDKYEICKGQKRKSVFNDCYQFTDKKFAEMLRETLQLKLQDDLESRELARVAIAMCFAAAYPVVALKALDNLLSTLTTPAAESLAGNAISTISSFATKWALKDAANHPEKARELMMALASVCVTHPNKHSHYNPDNLTTDPLQGNSNLHFYEPHKSIETEEIIIKDKETGKIVDVFYVDTATEVDYNHELEHLYSHSSAMTNVSNASRLAQSIDKEAERIFGEASLERLQVSRTNEELSNIDNLMSDITDPQQVSGLKAQKSHLNTKKNFLTYG